MSTKLYEDYLTDLGIASLTARLRLHSAGCWEVRLRWWACVNPGCLRQRGLPHARLRDTTYTFAPAPAGQPGAGVLRREVAERALRFDESAEAAAAWELEASLDPDAMAPHLIPVLPGLGRIVALYHCASTSYQIHQHIRCLYF